MNEQMSLVFFDSQCIGVFLVIVFSHTGKGKATSKQNCRRPFPGCHQYFREFLAIFQQICNPSVCIDRIFITLYEWDKMCLSVQKRRWNHSIESTDYWHQWSYVTVGQVRPTNMQRMSSDIKCDMEICLTGLENINTAYWLFVIVTAMLSLLLTLL